MAACGGTGASSTPMTSSLLLQPSASAMPSARHALLTSRSRIGPLLRFFRGAVELREPLPRRARERILRVALLEQHERAPFLGATPEGAVRFGQTKQRLGADLRVPRGRPIQC